MVTKDEYQQILTEWFNAKERELKAEKIALSGAGWVIEKRFVFVSIL